MIPGIFNPVGSPLRSTLGVVAVFIVCCSGGHLQSPSDSVENTYPAYRRFVCGPMATALVQHVRPLRDLTENER